LRNELVTWWRGLLDRTLPVRGGEIAAQVLNPTQPMNELIRRASSNHGRAIRFFVVPLQDALDELLGPADQFARRLGSLNRAMEAARATKKRPLDGPCRPRRLARREVLDKQVHRDCTDQQKSDRNDGQVRAEEWAYDRCCRLHRIVG
jgi:hypothetical protein